MFLNYFKENSKTLNVYIQEAETLVSKRIHPQTIISGWRMATDEARKALTNFAKDHGYKIFVLFVLPIPFHCFGEKIKYIGTVFELLF